MPVKTRSQTGSKASAPIPVLDSDLEEEEIILRNGVRLLSQKELDESKYHVERYGAMFPVVVKIDDYLFQPEYYCSEVHGIKSKDDCAKLGKLYALAPKKCYWDMEIYRFYGGDEEWILKDIYTNKQVGKVRNIYECDPTCDIHYELRHYIGNSYMCKRCQDIFNISS